MAYFPYLYVFLYFFQLNCKILHDGAICLPIFSHSYYNMYTSLVNLDSSHYVFHIFQTFAQNCQDRHTFAQNCQDPQRYIGLVVIIKFFTPEISGNQLKHPQWVNKKKQKQNKTKQIKNKQTKLH